MSRLHAYYTCGASRVPPARATLVVPSAVLLTTLILAIVFAVVTS